MPRVSYQSREDFYQKEEIPIHEVQTGAVRKPYFRLPVHPVFRNDDARVDRITAQAIFADVVNQWYKGLSAYAVNMKEEWEKEWYRNFLREKPFVEKTNGVQYIGPKKIWKDDVDFLKNGFAYYFELEMDSAGSICIYTRTWTGQLPTSGPGT